jgi:hypothetical protein
MSQVGPRAAALLGDEEASDIFEAALRKLGNESHQAGEHNDVEVDEIFCCAALLGASALQVDSTVRVRRAAAIALEELARQRNVYDGAKKKT